MKESDAVLLVREFSSVRRSAGIALLATGSEHPSAAPEQVTGVDASCWSAWKVVYMSRE